MDSVPHQARSNPEAPSIEFVDGSVSDPVVLHQHPHPHPHLHSHPHLHPQHPHQHDHPQHEDLPEKTSICGPHTTKGKEACCPSNGRNICVSADGTLGKFGAKNSNVVELHSRIIKDDRQLAYYISGIGTYGESRIDRWWDSAVAASFQRNVLKAYKWLCNNYRPGDRIFLFGFSRGAYQIRVIAGMIERVGLLYKGSNTQLPSVFKLYMKTMEKSTQTSDAGSPELSEARQQCDIFKKAFSQPHVKVHFVGAWDTVSSVGIVRAPCLPETTTGMAHVCHFRQALALDERRVRFWPEHANGSTKESTGGDVKEVWFVGSHSDIGGWSVLNKGLDSFGPALRWMTYEAMNNGLRMHQHTKGWASLAPTASLTGVWHVFEYLPIRRPSYRRGISRRLHNGAPRQIQAGQRIHKSVFEAMGVDTDTLLATESSTTPEALASDGYKPLARFSDKGNDSWDNIRDLIQERLEDDPFASANFAVQRLKDAVDSDDATFEAAIEVLKLHVFLSQNQVICGHAFHSHTHSHTHTHGPLNERQSLKPLGEVSTDVSTFLLLTLEREVEREDNMRAEVITVLLSALVVVPPHPKVRLKASVFCTIAAELPAGESRRLYRQVVRRYGHEPLGSLTTGHGCAVDYAAFSSNEENLLFVGSSDAVEIWDYKTWTRKVCMPLDHSSVKSVGASADGSQCVTGHNDGSVRLWNMDTGRLLRVIKDKAETHSITAVALSPDKNMIGSGSIHGVIRVWDTESGEDLLGGMEGHDMINSVAFSSDGSKLASSSEDHSIRLWDTKNGQMLKLLEGHQNHVEMVAFSSCAEKLISASCDKTVCIWDTTSGELVKRLEGHTDLVVCASFSPNQDIVVSGSMDKSIRVWDSGSGEIFAVYEVPSEVLSVAFSGDGKKIISGCNDGGVYIWDASFLV